MDNPLHGDGLPFGGLSLPTFLHLHGRPPRVGTVLAAAYLLWLYQLATAFGEPNPEFVADAHLAHSVGAAANPHDDEHADIHDVGPYEWIAWVPLLIGILVLGVYLQLLFKVTDPAATHLLGVFGGKNRASAAMSLLASDFVRPRVDYHAIACRRSSSRSASAWC